MKEEQPSLKKILQPYLLITVAGLLAFAPISFMLRALKNDIIALEYPINHFMSQSIHNGEIPYWFNTWGMGFPLQSNLTWGIFSTPQMFFSSLFNYNIYTLHIEFIFFVLLAGWGMFHLLQKHILKDQKLSQLLAICYMLSGFMVGSTQWLLYITAAAFIPLSISSLLDLLRIPSIKNSIQFAVVYTLMFTSVYAAFNIITTYSLLIFILFWISFFEKTMKKRITVIKYLGFTGFLTLLLCLPCLYFTAEVLNHIGRGSSITSNNDFFNSNYLHPASLSSLLLPLSTVKMSFANTEGTMLHSYVGILFLLLLPISIWKLFKEKNKPAMFISFAVLLYLLISFGEMTPFRNALNILPGFSYFRNPAIFRLYFIISLVIFVAITFKNKNFDDTFFSKNLESKSIFRTGVLLLFICIAVILANFNNLRHIHFNGIEAFIRNISYKTTLLTSAIIQACILITILFFLKSKQSGLLRYILIFDLIINTLICTPFYSVSSSSISEVNAILLPAKGFPLQTKSPAKVATTYLDSKNNTWYNVNIFKKQVSTNDSYRGPLTLNNFSSDTSEKTTSRINSIVYIEDSNEDSNSIQLLIQRPTYIKASVKVSDSSIVTVYQNFYTGWKVFYNNNEIEILRTHKPGMSIQIPKGQGIVEFKYERRSLWLSALILHLIILGFLIWRASRFFKKFILRSSSLS